MGKSKLVSGVIASLVGTLCCIAGVFLLLQDTDEVSMVTQYKGSSVCGLSSVANICGMFGNPMEITEVYNRVGEPLDHKRGISLLSCKRALESFGINCTSLRFKSIDEIPEATPFILTVLIGKDNKGEDRLHAVAAIRRDKHILLIDGQKVSIAALDYMNKHVGNVALVTNKINKSN